MHLQIVHASNMNYKSISLVYHYSKIMKTNFRSSKDNNVILATTKSTIGIVLCFT